MTGEEQQKRLASIFDKKTDTTKGGAQRVKFIPSVPPTRNKKEEPVQEVLPEEETEKTNIGRRPNTRRQPASNTQPQEVRGIFAEGISTLGSRKHVPTSLSSIIGGGSGGGGRRGVDMTMACVEPDSVDSAVDMREIFSAVTALHTPTIIDSDRFVIEESDLECVQLPPEGEYFLLQIPFLPDNKDDNQGEADCTGCIRMHESGRTSLVIGDRQYQVNPVVMNLADTYKLVSVEGEVAYDLGSVHSKKLTASIKL